MSNHRQETFASSNPEQRDESAADQRGTWGERLSFRKIISLKLWMNIFVSLNKTGRLKTTAGTRFWPRHNFLRVNLRNWPNRNGFSFRRQPQKCKLATWNKDDEADFPANTCLNLICGQILLRRIIVLPITGWKRDAHLFMRRARWKKSERERRRRFSLCDSFSDRLLKSHGNIFLNILHKNKSDFCPPTMRATQKRWRLRGGEEDNGRHVLTPFIPP